MKKEIKVGFFSFIIGEKVYVGFFFDYLINGLDFYNFLKSPELKLRVESLGLKSLGLKYPTTFFSRFEQVANVAFSNTFITTCPFSGKETDVA